MNTTYREIVTAAASEARAIWQQQLLVGDYRSLRLCVIPSTATAPGQLIWTRGEMPDGAEPVAADRLHAGIPFERFPQWVYDRARRAPLYPTGKVSR